jgi:tRNA (uracil-5-)-methyltransferase TRM9
VGLRWPAEPVIRFLGRTFPREQRASGLRVLDLGCGSGRNAIAMASEGFEAYAVDTDQPCVDIATEWARKEGLPLQVSKGNATDTGFPSAMFDIVIAWGLFCMLDTVVVQAMNEVSRVLKPGGVFFANWRSTGDYLFGKGAPRGKNTFLLDERCQPHGLAGVTYTFYSYADLIDLYTESGFLVSDVERRDIWTQNEQVLYSWRDVWAKKTKCRDESEGNCASVRQTEELR